MKSKSSSARSKKSPASDLLGPKLAVYSATALAALVVAPNAHAQVVLITSFSYSGLTNTTTPPSLTLQTHSSALQFYAGSIGFNFSGRRATHNGGGGSLFFQPSGGGLVSGVSHTVAAKKLTLGSAIKGQNFGARLLFSGNYDNTVHGSFLPPANGAVTGYVGFKGSHSGHNYYGWLNVKATADANDFPLGETLVAKSGDPGVFGAYLLSTTPGADTFGAGDTSVAAVPEPADAAMGLGLLAFGAAGVREMRHRRKNDA